MNHSRLDSRLGVRAPMATSKNRASEVWCMHCIEQDETPYQKSLGIGEKKVQ